MQRSTPGTSAARRASLRAVAIACVIVSALLMILLAHVDWTPLQFDELTELAMGARMARGQTPYVDFHEFRPPAFLLWHEALFDLLGARLLAFRFVMLGAWALAWLLVWRTLRAVVPKERRGWLLASCLGGWWLLSWWPLSYCNWWGMTLLLAWICCELRRWLAPEPRLPRLVAWVALLALLPLTSQTAAMACAPAVIACAIVAWREPLQRRSFLLHLGISAALGVLLLAVLASQSLLLPAIRDAVLWPLTQYKQAGGFNDVSLATDFLAATREALERRGPVLALASSLSLGLVLLAAPATAAMTLTSRPAKAGALARWVPFALAAGAAIAWLTGRHDLRHLIFVLPPVFLALALGLACDPAPGRRRAWELARATTTLAGVLVGTLPLVRGFGPVPSLEAWQGADTMYSGLVGAARSAATANGGSLVVISRGGLFEFYGVPLALPRSSYVDVLPLVTPAAPGTAASADETEAAEILRRERPPFVLVYPVWEVDRYLATGEGPLASLLRSDYRTFRELADARFLQRR